MASDSNTQRVRENVMQNTYINHLTKPDPKHTISNKVNGSVTDSLRELAACLNMKHEEWHAKMS